MAPAFCNRCGDALEGCDPRDELTELDVLLERLILKRYDLKRKINRFHSPIVRHLPPDVMSTIFEFCLPDVTDHQFSPIPPYIKMDVSSPLSLGAICSYWRDIALSAPSLWSSLVVRDPSGSYSHIITVIAQEWLARSGRLPLSIRILSTFYNKTVAALIDIINQYSNRWSDLDLDMPDRYYQHLHATDNHVPILKSIRLRGIPSVIARNLNFQLTCPRLERASISYFPLDGINIQWDNLTHLTLHSISIIDSFIILRKTHRLVFCKILDFCSHPSLDERNIRAPVLLTSLRSLHLLINRSPAQVFLDNLTAPHLEEFNLQRYYVSRIEVIAAFLRRSACSLRSFSTIFTVFRQHFESFMNLLQSMPSLTTLSISSITTSSKTRFTPDEYNPQNVSQLVAKVLSSQSTPIEQGFLPNLSILEFTGELYLYPGNYDDLYSLPPADNAVHGPFHLLNLNLYSTTRIPKNMISYVSSLMERGVTVNVLSDSKDILQSSIDYYTYKKDSLSRDWTDNFDSTFFS